ncbi:MAG: LLM class flavin-dependent oxidoreductase [Solirubrobacteraceae bacterium]
MKVGLALGTPYESLDAFDVELEIARAAGVDSVWIPDHLWGIFHPELWDRMSYSDAASTPDAYADPLALAGLLAGRVDVPIGTGVVDATRRRAPDMLRAALTVHHMSPAGFILGVGSGEAENIVPFGYPFDRPVGKLQEFLIEARSLLDDGQMPEPLRGTLGLPATHNGYGKLQLWVAAHGPRALRLTGTYADGWISIFVDPAVFTQQQQQVAEAAARAGRPMPQMRCTMLVILGESREEVIARLDAEPLAKLIAMTAPAELWLAFGLEKPGSGGAGYRDMLVPDVDPEELSAIASRIPAEMLEALGVYLGSGEEIAARLEPYRDAGVELLMIANYSGFVGGLTRVKETGHEFAELTRRLT